jgi:hypothetical protein
MAPDVPCGPEYDLTHGSRKQRRYQEKPEKIGERTIPDLKRNKANAQHTFFPLGNSRSYTICIRGFRLRSATHRDTLPRSSYDMEILVSRDKKGFDVGFIFPVVMFLPRADGSASFQAHGDSSRPFLLPLRSRYHYLAVWEPS